MLMVVVVIMDFCVLVIVVVVVYLCVLVLVLVSVLVLMMDLSVLINVFKIVVIIDCQRVDWLKFKHGVSYFVVTLVMAIGILTNGKKWMP